MTGHWGRSLARLLEKLEAADWGGDACLGPACF